MSYLILLNLYINTIEIVKPNYKIKVIKLQKYIYGFFKPITKILIEN